MVAISLLSVGLTAAMAVSGAVFAAVSGIVETVYHGATVRRTRNAELTKMQRQLDDEVASSKRLRRDLAETVAERDRIRRELAERTVPYRGSRRLAREAVADTSDRVARRLAAGAARTVASTAGEALPFVGAGVIAAATAYELYDACEMMKELHALDVAFNPDSAVSDREVCGMRAPTGDEIWASVKASPSAAWSTVAGLYQELDADDAGAIVDSVKGWIPSFNPWADAEAPGPEPGQAPDEAPAPADP